MRDCGAASAALAASLLAAVLALTVGSREVAAQESPPGPPPGEPVVLWPEGVPGALPGAGAEAVEEGGLVSNVHQPTLTPYLAPEGRRTGAAVIICPGGGYTRLAVDHEGVAPARWLNGLGVSAFILKYRLKEYGHPAPLRDVLRAVRTVRANAASFDVDPARIGVMGFSAGGHLAASSGTLFDAPEGRTGAALDRVSARPDFLILVYPVIQLNTPFTHAGSRQALVGASPAPGLVDALSLDTRVTKDTTPAFLVHGGTDTGVPPENSLAFYAALRRAGVPAELHIYEKGAHGFGLRPGLGPVSDWPRRCAEWLAARGLI
ncbi:MAG TPA: alpha/beta hydrolase [Vicinamibacterales bacterium]|nr:alpha/beta hydrolase [Vicinamibacterales bacterium]HPK71742.1 alpha/beta hydrolase [Vicinamibacterales bacterium]